MAYTDDFMNTHQHSLTRSGYTIVGASFVIQGTIVGAIFTYGVFFDALHGDLGWSRAVISAGSSLASLVMGVSAMIFGGLTDRIGPRRIMVGAGVLISLGYLVMSQLTAPWQLLLGYPILVGIAFGSHDVVTLSTVARWFDARRGIMSAVVKAGTGLGQVVGPAVAALLIAAFGWRAAYAWIALGTGPVVIIAGRLMRQPPGVGEHYQSVPRDSRSPVLPVMKSRAFTLVAIAQSAVFFCTPIVIVHIVPYATDIGLPRAVAAGILSLIGGVSIIGRLTVGVAIDKIGSRISLLSCQLIMLGSFVLLQFATTAPLLYLFAVIYGFAHGGMFTAVSPLVAQLFGMHTHGQLYGTVIFLGTLTGALGPIMAGLVHDVTGNYQIAFLLPLLLLGVAATAIHTLRSVVP